MCSSHNFWNPVRSPITTTMQKKMMQQQSRSLSLGAGSEDGECSVPPRMTIASQDSSLADDDIEGGGNASYHSSSDEEDEMIRSKFKPSRGNGFMRRASQTSGLTSRNRARSEPVVAEPPTSSSSKYHRRSAIFADPPPYEPVVAEKPIEEPPAPSGGGNGKRIVGWTLIGLGGAAAVLSGTRYPAFDKQKDEYDTAFATAGCDTGGCTGSATDYETVETEYKKLKSIRTQAYAGWAAAGVLGVAGAVLVLTSGSGAEVSWVPPAGASVSVRF